MSSPEYTSYPGFGSYVLTHLGYSQTVRVPSSASTIHVSGQGGWDPHLTDPAGLSFPPSIREEIQQAFRNVDHALRYAGGKGWSQVFRVNSYHTVLDEEATGVMVEEFARWFGEGAQRPVWTQVGVTKLGAEGMRVEIEVQAWDERG